MMNLGLTPEQLAQRKLGVGGSDAGKIMAGEWRALWMEKTGRADPEDLSGVLAVQMGSATEDFNAFWYTKKTGRPILSRGQRVISSRYPHMIANLDGVTQMSRGYPAYWDAKHVGRLDEATVLRYTPQMVHCCTILGLDWWVLSVFIGNSKWEIVEQEVDPMYQATLIAREADFWGYVTRDEEPPETQAPPVLAPKPTPTLRSIVVPVEEDEVYGAMCRKDNWLSEARDHIRAIIGTDAAAKVNAINREEMKTLVPSEIGEIKYGRYRFARSKAGAVTQAVTKLEDIDDGAA
jgi:hypothetical protein